MPSLSQTPRSKSDGMNALTASAGKHRGGIVEWVVVRPNAHSHSHSHARTYAHMRRHAG